jgi:hypothetical protein
MEETVGPSVRTVAPLLLILTAALLSPTAAEEPTGGTEETPLAGWQVASDINLTLTQSA